jgi:DNA-binding MarR family transcriptional regulator
MRCGPVITASLPSLALLGRVLSDECCALCPDGLCRSRFGPKPSRLSTDPAPIPVAPRRMVWSEMFCVKTISGRLPSRLLGVDRFDEPLRCPQRGTLRPRARTAPRDPTSPPPSKAAPRLQPSRCNGARTSRLLGSVRLGWYPGDVEDAEHPLDGDVNWLLNRVWLGFGQRKAAALEAVGVTLKEHFVMVALLSGPMPQLELSALVKIDKSVITATVDALEAKGLVVRAPDPRDRRVRRPTLTPSGRKVCRRATAATTAAEQDLLELLEPAQREVFLSALRYYTFSEFVDAPEFTRRLRK